MSEKLFAGSAAGADAAPGLELFAEIEETNRQSGAYTVEADDFAGIYRFVMRIQDRMDKQAHLVSFCFHSRLNTPPEPGTVEEGFRIVQRCLRRGDIACMNGQTILAILMGADEEGCRVAADRIVSTYEAHCSGSAFTLKYEMREIRS